MVPPRPATAPALRRARWDHEAGAGALEPPDESPDARQGAREAHVVASRPHPARAANARLVGVEFPGVQTGNHTRRYPMGVMSMARSWTRSCGSSTRNSRKKA